MKQCLLLLLALLCLSPISAQISGTVIDDMTKEPVFGAKLIASDGKKSLSDVNGNFNFASQAFPIRIVTTAIGYLPDTTEVTASGSITIKLTSEVQKIDDVVVSAGRRKQGLEEVAISMEIIRPELVENKGLADLEQAVDQSPGCYAMDGQVSIRGGSGFAYGAGSRVMLLWNGMPMLSGDAGDTKWNTIPLESTGQIEIMKGASSVLYGSGALNGIISLTEKEPTPMGETRFKVQSGIYDNPKRESLKWWVTNPTFHQADVYNAKMYKKWGYSIAANGFTSDGYKAGETEDRARINGKIYFRPEKIDHLKVGIGFNLQAQTTGNFIIWESDSLAYTPSGGADISDSNSTLTYNKGLRLSIDPHIKYIDKKQNVHTLKSRYYEIKNTNVTNESQSSSSKIYYADYQFQHQWKFGLTATTGLTATRNDVLSNLFGDHHSNNYAYYLQMEQNLWNRLDITAGVRAEYFEQDTIRGDSDFTFGKDSTVLPFYPVFRAGIHYEVHKGTHLRVSYGQGIRYPSVAERYTFTNVGALNIFPNPELRPEIGWAAEAGIKQVFSIAKNWKGILDVAGFINQYDNMMEFTFGFYLPDTIPPSLNPSKPGYVKNWYGFKANNAEQAKITGIETSFNSIGKIGPIEVTTLLGYTYMEPMSLNTDSTYLKTFSDSGSTLLKYRFKHLAKGDIELGYKNYSIGFSLRYNSFMSNIDALFEDGLKIIGGDQIDILPGLKEYREENNTGTTVMDLRCGYEINEKYRLGFIVNNIANLEYATRPGDIQAPRNFILQLQAKF